MIFILLAIFVLLVGCYIGTTIFGRNFYWHWSIFLILLFFSIAVSFYLGALAGTFNHTLASEYRQFFWSEFASTVESTATFADSVREMQQKFDNGEFSTYQTNILPPPPPLWWLVAGYGLLSIAVAWSIGKKRPWNRIGVLLFSLTAATFFCFYSESKYFLLFSSQHLRMTARDQTYMLEAFAARAGDVPLSQTAIANAMRNYFEQNRRVCHGEPYSMLETDLFGEESDDANIQTVPTADKEQNRLE